MAVVVVVALLFQIATEGFLAQCARFDRQVDTAVRRRVARTEAAYCFTAGVVAVSVVFNVRNRLPVIHFIINFIINFISWKWSSNEEIHS